MTRSPKMGLLCFDVGTSDHLRPLLGFVGDKLPEISWRAGKDGVALSGKNSPELWIPNPTRLLLHSGDRDQPSRPSPPPNWPCHRTAQIEPKKGRFAAITRCVVTRLCHHRQRVGPGAGG